MMPMRCRCGQPPHLTELLMPPRPCRFPQERFSAACSGVPIAFRCAVQVPAPAPLPALTARDVLGDLPAEAAAAGERVPYASAPHSCYAAAMRAGAGEAAAGAEVSNHCTLNLDPDVRDRIRHIPREGGPLGRGALAEEQQCQPFYPARAGNWCVRAAVQGTSSWGRRWRGLASAWCRPALQPSAHAAGCGQCAMLAAQLRCLVLRPSRACCLRRAGGTCRVRCCPTAWPAAWSASCRACTRAYCGAHSLPRVRGLQSAVGWCLELLLFAAYCHSRTADTLLRPCTPAVLTDPSVYSHSTSTILHPEADRPLTVREYARVQGVPDAVAFAGTTAEAYKQVRRGAREPGGAACAACGCDVRCACLAAGGGSLPPALHLSPPHGSRAPALHPAGGQLRAAAAGGGAGP